MAERGEKPAFFALRPAPPELPMTRPAPRPMTQRKAPVTKTMARVQGRPWSISLKRSRPQPSLPKAKWEPGASGAMTRTFLPSTIFSVTDFV